MTQPTPDDYEAQRKRAIVRLSKAGKPRHVALNKEGHKLFASLTASSGPADLIFRRTDGKA